mmetsp:Transcript_85680/g.256647  ORF Transcript_85680/g.256647 Transcript_85680/m.256647 type:complete len:212 (-) Transcript_85680:2506-3141(-)
MAATAASPRVWLSSRMRVARALFPPSPRASATPASELRLQNDRSSEVSVLLAVSARASILQPSTEAALLEASTLVRERLPSSSCASPTKLKTLRLGRITSSGLGSSLSVIPAQILSVASDALSRSAFTSATWSRSCLRSSDSSASVDRTQAARWSALGTLGSESDASVRLLPCAAASKKAPAASKLSGQCNSLSDVLRPKAAAAAALSVCI